MAQNWYPVIGLEVHIQLLTESKLFSTALTGYGSKPNTQASLVDLGLPGTLPILNKQAIHQAIRFGFASSAKVNQDISFDRKNYFYPDLPKGYQITQHYNPILWGGHITIERPDGSSQVIRIHHTHLEEDAGKSLHDYASNMTGIDLNRAGMPLLEIVSEPDLRTAEDAVTYLKTLHSLIVYLGICDGNMQEGSMRCDANVSIRKSPEAPFGTRVEIKNINSFKFVEKAIQYEIKRQSQVLQEGGIIKQQTRLYDESTGTTKLMRDKEQAHDYRYHPEPDIPTIHLPDSVIMEIKESLPELPDEKKLRFIEAYGLSGYDAKILSQDKDYATFFEQVMTIGKAPAKSVCNWLLGPVAAAINRSGLSLKNSHLTPEKLSNLLHRVEDGTISNNIAKSVFEEVWEVGTLPDTIIAQKGLKIISDEKSIRTLIQNILDNNEKQLLAYQSGNEKIYGYFVGQAMKASQGKVDPQKLNKILKDILGKS